MPRRPIIARTAELRPYWPLPTTYKHNYDSKSTPLGPLSADAAVIMAGIVLTLTDFPPWRGHAENLRYTDCVTLPGGGNVD